MKLTAIAAVAALGVAVSGCASVIKGSHQFVAVISPPVSGAACTLYNTEGSYAVTTPNAVKVGRTKNDLTVICRKDGYRDSTKIVESHFNGATAGNVLIGGLVGITVDAATGADNSYPETIEVPMTPMGDASAAPVAAPAPAASSAPSS